MPLSDVEQTAGGLGRVSRSSTPHVLLLSYDYPGQSVRVSLSRRNVSAEYRVRSVSLYQGNVLLRRHSG